MKYLISLEIDAPKRLRLEALRDAFTADQWYSEELAPTEVSIRVMQIRALRQIKPKARKETAA